MSALDESDLVFWSRQLSEHALFIYLGLEQEPLKSKGMELHQQWEEFRSTFPSHDYQGDECTVDKFNQMVSELKNYKITILTQLTACTENTDQHVQWMGWISPNFVEHVTRELNFAFCKVNKQSVPLEDEINFWNLTNKEHALFTAQLLDSSETALVKLSHAIADKLAQDDDFESKLFVKISLEGAKELEALHRQGKSLMDKNQLRTIIHPVLLTHVIREGQRSIATLGLVMDKLNMNQNEAIQYEMTVYKKTDVFDDYSRVECNLNGKTVGTFKPN